MTTSSPKYFSTDLFAFLRRNRQGLVIVFIFSVLLALLYYQGLTSLFNTWMNDKAYSHGFFIPIISLYLIWLKRDFLPKIAVKPSRIYGSIAIILSLVLLLVGRVGVIVQIETISFLLILPAIILFCLGWQFLKALALPLFYLQFMVPWLDPIINRIYLPFQLISAQLGTFFLKLMGYPVFHDRIFIYLPNISLEVAKACSGIQFLFSVMAIGLALVYLTQKTWWRAAFVMLMGVVIVIISNGVRVALAGVMGQNFGAELLHGPGHILRGWFVAQVGYVGIFLVNWLVSKRKSPIATRLYERGAMLPKPINTTVANLNTALRPAIILVVFLATFSGYLYLYATPKPVPTASFTIPYRLGSWYGQDDTWFNSSPYFPSADRIISRTYTNPQAQEVKLFIVYYTNQNASKRLVSYLSRPLYAKGEDTSTNKLENPARVRRALSEIDNKKYETIFWFHLPSGDFTSRKEVKTRTVVDAIFNRKNYAAFILLAEPAKVDKPASELYNFLSVVAPEIDKFLP